MKQHAISAGKAPIPAHQQFQNAQTVWLELTQMPTEQLVVGHVYQQLTHLHLDLKTV